MMKKLVKIYSIFLFLALSGIEITAQTTSAINVTVNTGNGAGSVYQAFIDANTEMAAGNNVEILFNAPGLCQIETVYGYLPELTTSNAVTVSLKKHTSASVPQGVQLGSGSVLDPTIIWGVKFNGISAGSIVVEGIELRNLTNENVTSRLALDIGQSTNTTISSNIIDGGVKLNQFCEQIEIIDNIIGGPGNTGSNYGIEHTVSGSNQKNIKRNTITDFALGISVLNEYENSNVVVYDNTLQGCYVSLNMKNPYLNWVIDFNNFNQSEIGISINLSEVQGPVGSIQLSNRGINFIYPNGLGYIAENGSNTFTGTVQGTILTGYVAGVMDKFDAGVKIVGLNLDKGVKIVSCEWVQVRDNIITDPLPIELIEVDPAIGFGNNNIPSPQITNMGVDGSGNLLVDYSNPGLFAINGSFVLDFYRSNAQGHLLEYLGNYPVSTNIVNGGSEAINTGITGVMLGEEIAVTVSSLGDQNNLPLGTSEATYSSTKSCFANFSHYGELCTNRNLNFTNTSIVPTGYTWTYNWDFGDGNVSTDQNPVHFYALPGTYQVSLQLTPSPAITDPDCSNHLSITQTIVIGACENVCETCLPSFAPIPGEEYVLSAWVKETSVTPLKTYEGPEIILSFPNSGSADKSFKTSSGTQIIEGWQRIEQAFIVPADATSIEVHLKNTNLNGGNDVYFDDIRIHPFNSSMKSFVYDPKTLRLWAELDERNFATFYEYDEEGKLIRIKKETERGVETIQESRGNIAK